MNIYRQYLMAALMMALAVSASAVTVLVPENTVIPVTLDNPLSSVTNRVGDVFSAHYEGITGGEFPHYTNFTGKVRSVTQASGTTAGEIGVDFVSAHLPDGTSVPIIGQLTSLDEASVKTDPDTGRLVGTSEARKASGKFIAIGAGAGLLIGELSGKNEILYTVLGAAAGYLYGQNKGEPAIGKDVQVPADTKFGILLTQDVTIPDPKSAAMPGSTGAGPNTGPGWQVTFKNLQPMMSGNDLMVPFRSVMNSIEMPFDYYPATKRIRVNNYESQAVHTVGTRIIDVNGQYTRMDTASRIINGSLYVPASYIELLTGRTAYWNQKSGVLRIE